MPFFDCYCQVQNKFNWLSVRGSKKHVCVDAGKKFQNAERLHPWLDLFNTQFFGYIQQLSLASAIITGYSSDFENLESDLDHYYKQREGQLCFCLPDFGNCQSEIYLIG